MTDIHFYALCLSLFLMSFCMCLWTIIAVLRRCAKALEKIAESGVFEKYPNDLERTAWVDTTAEGDEA